MYFGNVWEGEHKVKIREGFVTNSSSTNFIIISKKDITSEYLFKKLGFKKNSPLRESAMELCENIIYGAEYGLRWYDMPDTVETVQKIFGAKTAEIYKSRKEKGHHIYYGHTNSDGGDLTCFFTSDSFEIDTKNFYINGKNCVW